MFSTSHQNCTIGPALQFPVNPGTNYNIGNTLTLTGGNNDASINVDNIDGIPGAIVTASIGDGVGSGYSIGTTVDISGGNNDATIIIDDVSDSGQVVSFHIGNAGTGYSTGNIIGTTTEGDGDNNLNINIDSVGHGAITAYTLTGGTGYVVGNYGVTGGDGNDATFNVDTISTKTLLERLNISNLPTSNVGLSSGDIWNDSGLLRVI